MNCYLSAVTGIGLLTASAFTTTVSKEQHDAVVKTLSPELADRYEKIVAERRNYYLQGLILGFFVAFFFVGRRSIPNKFYKITLFTAVALIVGVTYYTVMPKSDYMLQHLKNEEQIKAWLEVYKTMRSKYITGFLLGALAAIPLANAMC